MNLQNWPSGRFVIVITIALLLGAGWTAFRPAASPGEKAERLYTEAWFAAYTPCYYPEGSDSKSLEMIEKALKLKPGEPRYEEALVWFTQNDLRELKALLVRRGLSPEARRLGYGLVALNSLETRGNRPPDDTIISTLKAAIEHDPDNAYSQILYADVLMQLGSRSEALEWTARTTKAHYSRAYYPSIPLELRGTVASALILAGGPNWSSHACMRRLAKALIDIADEQLRSEQPLEAIRTLQTAIGAARRLGEIEPEATINVLFAKALFELCRKQLRPIYKDRGMTAELKVLDRQEQVYERTDKSIRKLIDAMVPMLVVETWKASALGMGMFGAGLLTGIWLVLFALLWCLAARARRKTDDVEPEMAPWPEGWLARRFLAVNAAALVLGWLGIRASIATIRGHDAFCPTLYSVLMLAILGATAQVVVLGIALKRLKAVCVADSSGEKVRWRWFLSGSPPGIKAWTRKHMAAASAAGLLFLACVLLLTIILYKPLVGHHPWQMWRMTTTIYDDERALVRRWATEMKQASSLCPPAPKAIGNTETEKQD